MVTLHDPSPPAALRSQEKRPEELPYLEAMPGKEDCILLPGHVSLFTKDAINTNTQNITDTKATIGTSDIEEILVSQFYFTDGLLRNQGQLAVIEAFAILCVFPGTNDVDVHEVSPFHHWTVNFVNK
jgi:hypothetical protein